jgi:NitT/TauT family transport system substrate-binding protein
MRRYIIIALFFAALLSGCDNKTSRRQDLAKTITIAYLPITHALPLVGLDKINGVDVKLIKYGSWPELLDALNAGRVDGASMLIELAMKAKEQGIPLKAYALGHSDGNVIVVGSHVKNLKEIRGKTFAIPHRMSSHYILLLEALKKEGMTAKDIHIVELSPPEMSSALSNGQIAGYCVAEPFGALSVAQGTGRVLFYSKDLWKKSICCALVFNEKAIAGKEALVKKLVKIYQANGKKLTNKGYALEKAQQILTPSAKVLQQSLKWIDYANLKIERADYESLAVKVKASGIITNPPAYENFVETGNP